jgi:hypothetical protein
LELPGAGRVVADGTVGDEAWTQRMDSWIIWEVEEEAVRKRGVYFFVLGDSHPEMCAQRNGGGFLLLWSQAGPRPVSYVCAFPVVYIPLWGKKDYKRERINQSIKLQPMICYSNSGNPTAENSFKPGVVGFSNS